MNTQVSGAQTPIRLLAIADTDSYLKWSSATLATLTPGWQRSQVVVENPVMPSAAQMRAASSLPVQVLDRAGIVRRLRAERPDVVLLACTGPVVAALTAIRELRGRSRPVLVTGLPGISVPATSRALQLRRSCDLFVLHSLREIAEFRAIGAEVAPHLVFGLASLPFLRAPFPASEDNLPRTDLIFAAQAKVPISREHRERILLALAEAGSAVVKVRAEKDEQQTHREQWPYPELMADLLATGRMPPGKLRCRGGSMQEALRTARALTTVSSTAALEAMAARIPVLIISEFGVSEEMINLVFAGSGCLGDLSDVVAGRWRQAEPAWLAVNYFHPAQDNDWLDRLDALVLARAFGTLPARPRTSGFPLRRVRRRVRLWLRPTWVRRLRSVERRIRYLADVGRPRQVGRVPGRHRVPRETSGSSGPVDVLPAGRPRPQRAIPPDPSVRNH